MKLDPKLLKRLEERDDANAVLAAALGVCPACGQPMPNENGATKPRKLRTGEVRDQIHAWRVQNPDGTQSACARALGCSAVYVNRVWHDAETPRVEAES